MNTNQCWTFILNLLCVCFCHQHILPQKSTIHFIPGNIFKGVLAVLGLVDKHLLSACWLVGAKKTEMVKFNQGAETQQSTNGIGCDESVRGSLVRDQEKNHKDMNWILGVKLRMHQRWGERGILGNGTSKWEEMDINSCTGCTLVLLKWVGGCRKWG